MTSHVFTMEGRVCYSGDELFQIKEQTEEHPRLGLVRWKKFYQSPPNTIPVPFKIYFEPADIRDTFLIWMDEKQISACCPKLLEDFLEGKISKLGPPSVGDEEDKVTEKEMKSDVTSLVKRCGKVLERYKSAEDTGNAMTMFANNIAILEAYAKVPELLQCLLDSGVVQLLADALLNSYREDGMHENTSKVLYALVSHVYSKKSANIILQLINVISDSLEDENLETLCHFEGVTLTMVDLFASTVRKDCCPCLEQMSYCEVIT